MEPTWLQLARGDAPLIVTFPHTGSDLPEPLADTLVSPWLARKDADHWVHLLYGFARELGASTLRTTLSRTVIDVNRDPSGAALYPGQAGTELCPVTTFDGEPLYRDARAPGAREIAARRERYFEPYHAVLAAEVTRLRERYPHVVVYDAHAIRSQIPRLFTGTLPELNLGSYDGRSCGPALATALEQECARSPFSWVHNGRFKGGWTTRHYGRPERGVHAVQMELACRGYLDEPAPPLVDANTWPPAYDPERAAPLAAVLRCILELCLDFARKAQG